MTSVRTKRPLREPVREAAEPKQKNYITLLMSFGIAWWLVAQTGVAESISLTRAEYPGWDVPTPVWVIVAGLIIWATTNAVNVTDGLDGLAGGSALMGYGAFMIIGYTTLRFPDIYPSVVNPSESPTSRMSIPTRSARSAIG